LVVRNLVQTRN